MGPLNRHRCRRTGRRAAVRDCQCIACAEQRSYARQWHKDQRRLDTPYAMRKRGRRENLPKLRAWIAAQDPIALAMYYQLRNYLKKDKATAP